MDRAISMICALRPTFMISIPSSWTLDSIDFDEVIGFGERLFLGVSNTL